MDGVIAHREGTRCFAKAGDKGADAEDFPAWIPDSRRKCSHPPNSITARRKARRQIGCALDYAALGGGTGGRSARGIPSVGPDWKFIG
jgi:hypothetical protein